MNVINEIIYDEQKMDFCEKSYFLIGYARWGTNKWNYYKPDVTEYSNDIDNFTRAIQIFSEDFKLGQANILSSLTFIMYPDENGVTFGNDDRELYSDLFNSDFYTSLTDNKVISEVTSYDTPNDLADLVLNKFLFSSETFEWLIRLFTSIPSTTLIFGDVFIEYDKIIIKLTWNGWGVYVKKGGDIHFTRWFFDLINTLCHLTPTILINEGNPLDDEYNPLESTKFGC